jgi:hypothetical protein
MAAVLWSLLAIFSLGYLLPTSIAGWRHHPNGAPIFLLNLFLGWTVIGWVVALMWASSSPEGSHTVIVTVPGATVATIPPSTPTLTSSPLQREIVFCAKCGKKREGTLNFCRHCGASLA